ncbi:unnamed protein product [Ranitomeya imitator]|uniref:Reverse transcriptase domain-containing protein n=1 Tax=Ranitomeya imitator TaxID=111125 RepID=A0ABN9LZG1_9NEOB|nr:unnamed protein product [Ranitomeya imitator]
MFFLQWNFMFYKKGHLHVRSNISKAEKGAIESLRLNKQFVVKPADKGGAVVVMDRQYYVNEIRSQLNDSDTYLRITHDPTSDITKEILTLSHRFCSLGVIDNKLGEFLINPYPICPVLYTLPKIHKNLTCPPGRPIVASTGSLLSPLAMVLEKILTPLLGHIPSFLRDTTHFLSAIRGLSIAPEDCYLVTLDVNSLYTNINNNNGIKAVETFLNDTTGFHPDLKAFCCALLTLILTKNFFLFEDEFFIQLNGTAMGSNVAPPYANIFMVDFESKFIYTHVLFQQFCPLWKRYIDDIFMIWCGDLDSLLSLYQSINTSVDKLTFTMQHDQKSISFLDTLVTINEDRTLSTDLFVKSTDKNSLLYFTSCHPHHIKRSLPRSQYSRINRIVSDPSRRTVRLNEMASKFRARGYPESFLDFPLDSSSSTKSQSRVNRMAFVNTYHPFMPIFHGLIHKHWSLLGLSYPTIPEFQVAPLMCHKKPPNLRNLLVAADIGSSKLVARQTFLATTRKGTFPCLHCLQCSNITRGDTFTHPRSAQRYNPYCLYSMRQRLYPLHLSTLGMYMRSWASYFSLSMVDFHYLSLITLSLIAWSFSYIQVLRSYQSCDRTPHKRRNYNGLFGWKMAAGKPVMPSALLAVDTGPRCLHSPATGILRKGPCSGALPTAAASSDHCRNLPALAVSVGQPEKQSGDVIALLSGCPVLTARPEKQSAEDRQRKLPDVYPGYWGPRDRWSLESCLCDSSPATKQRRCSDPDRCRYRCSVAMCDDLSRFVLRVPLRDFTPTIDAAYAAICSINSNVKNNKIIIYSPSDVPISSALQAAVRFQRCCATRTFVTSRSCDRDVTAGPGRIANLRPDGRVQR